MISARPRMQKLAGTPLSFTLTVREKSPEGAPERIGRRCEVVSDGRHTERVSEALHEQIERRLVSGIEKPQSDTHPALDGTARTGRRAPLRGRISVVHFGTRNGRNFMDADQLPSGWEGL